MDLNKAALCGRLQQTGPGWAQGHPRKAGGGGGEAQAGQTALESTGCAREKEACVTGSLLAYRAARVQLPEALSRWQKWAESTVNYS